MENAKKIIDRESKISLVAIGFLALFLELIFIRWLPANILSLWYFSNIVLISSFLGIGLGSVISSKIKDLFGWFPLALMFFVLFVISLRWFEVIIPSESTEWLWNFHYRGNVFQSFNFDLDLYSTLTLVFIANTSLFAFVGQKVGLLMSKFRPEKAYGMDLFGAILGVAVFGTLVALGGWFAYPSAWFVLAGVITLWLLKENRKFLIVGAACFVAIVSAVFFVSKDDIWSPYYSIQTKNGENQSLDIYVNRFFYQSAINFEKSEVAKWKYLLPYYFANPQKLLILGSGSGNDVATAGSVGVKKIDAVEIDPEIFNLGVKSHPLNPYKNPNVSVYIDDARSFLKKNDTKYDMIILGTLDSHALLSAMSTVRLDNFVYTTESLVDIKNHLSDKGIAVLQFSAPNEKFGARLLNIASFAFSDMPSVAYWGNNALFNLAFLAGPGLKEDLIKNLDTNLFTRLEIPKPKIDKTLPSDDWPYLYLSSRAIPSHYLKAIGILLFISCIGIIAAVRRKREAMSISNLGFFLLGVAFLLLETKSITSLSLLFGSTWVVNVFVFGSILTMLFLANFIISKTEIKNIKIIFLALAASLLLNFLLPAGFFLGMGYWAKSIFSALVAALPIFFSALIFSYYFKKVVEKNISLVYGINLAGAVCGGFLEYSSMITGLNFLYIIAGSLYLFAYLCLSSSQKPAINALQDDF